MKNYKQRIKLVSLSNIYIYIYIVATVASAQDLKIIGEDNAYNNALFAHDPDVTKIEWKGKEIEVFSNMVLIRVNRNYFHEKEALFSTIKNLPLVTSIEPSYGKNWDGWARVRFTGLKVNIVEFLQEMMQLDEVDLAEPEIVHRIESPPDDTWFDYQWNLNNTGENTAHTDFHDELVAGADIDALKAWGITKGSSNVIVAVFDTGIDLNSTTRDVHHPDMDDQNMHIKGQTYISGTSDVKDDNGHGTTVSGIIFAEKDNDEGIAGIAPGVKAIHYKVCDSDGDCKPSGFRDAAVHLIDNYVNNPSYSDYRFLVNYSAGGGHSPPLKTGVDTLDYENIPLITSAGNIDTSGVTALTYPGAYSGYDHLITVSASTHRDQWRATNRWGSAVTLAAPGGGVNTPQGVIYEVDDDGGLEDDLISCANANSFSHWQDWWDNSDPCNESVIYEDLYDKFDRDDNRSLVPTTVRVGTGGVPFFNNEDYGLHGASSIASPHVAAAAGLILSINNELDPLTIKNILINTADKVGEDTPYYNVEYVNGHSDHMGYGRLNAYEALIYTIENYGATLGADDQTVTIVSGTELNLQKDLYVESGGTLKIEPDVTINFMDDEVKIEIDGTFLAEGTSTDWITINGSGYDDNAIIANNGATIKYADFDNVPLSVSGSNATADIRDSKFWDADSDAITLEDLDDVYLYNNAVRFSSNSGLLLVNFNSFNMIFDNTFSDNSTGIEIDNSDIDDFFDNVMEDNIQYGITLYSGSDGWLTEMDEESSGDNRFKDNGFHQIGVSFDSQAFLGDDDMHVGLNTVYHHDWGGEYEYKYINNSNSSATVEAENTYWGGSPTAAMFGGDVNDDHHLFSDFTSGSGSTHAKMVAPDQGSEPAEQTRKERLLELISELDEDAYRSKNDHRLSKLYMYMRMDRENKMELRDQILATIEKWASRRTEISSTYEDSQEVRRAVETAMLLQVRLAFRNRDYEQADRLNDSFAQHIQLKENRLALLENKISIHIYEKEYELALQVLDQARTLGEGESFVDEQNLDSREAYLNKKLGQEVDNPEKNIAEDNRKTEEPIPAAFALKTSYPNPFNPVTIIPFELPESSDVRLEVYDLLGRQVAILTNQTYEAGRYEISWNASTVSSGVYIVRMMVNTAQGQHRQFNRQVTLLK